jgi:hypothetical protein
MTIEIVQGCGCCGSATAGNCIYINTFGYADTSIWKSDLEDYSIAIFKFDTNGISDDNADILVDGQIIGTVIGHVGPPPTCGSGQNNGALFLPTGLSTIAFSDIMPSTYFTGFGIRTDPNNSRGTLILNSSLLNNGKSISKVEIKSSTAIPSYNGCGNFFESWVCRIKNGSTTTTTATMTTAAP